MTAKAQSLLVQAQQDPADALWPRCRRSDQGVRQDHDARGRLCGPLFPVQPFRGLEPRRRDRQVGQFQHRRRVSACARWRARRPPFAYSDDISHQALGDAAAAVRAIAAAGQERRVPAREDEAAVTRSTCRTIRWLRSTRRQGQLLERLEAYGAGRRPRVTQVMAHIAGEYEVILVAGSDGRLAADIRPLVRVSLTVIRRSRAASANRARRAAAAAPITASSPTPCCRATRTKPCIRR
jgi:hypothetical protein